MTTNEERANDEQKTTTCFVCSNQNASLSERNEHFLEMRSIEGSLNEAVDISRIAWEQFPKLRESADASRLIDSLMEGFQERINNQVLAPISSTTTAMSAIIDRLKDFAETNPTLIDRGFSRTLEGLRAEMNTIRAAVQEPSAKITELNQLVNQLIYKPIAKGNAGEAILADLWTEHFSRDQVEKLGGAGREDLLIRPYLGDNGNSCYGEAISVERKTGKQKYTGSHREEAIRHAKERGASVALLIYDTQDNLPRSIQPVSLGREQGILIVVTDMHSQSWKMMRETIEIIQREMRDSEHDVSEINLVAIQQVVTELGNALKLVEQIKGSNSKIKNYAEEVEIAASTIGYLVGNYQTRLQAAITSPAKSNGESGTVPTLGGVVP